MFWLECIGVLKVNKFEKKMYIFRYIFWFWFINVNNDIIGLRKCMNNYYIELYKYLIIYIFLL